MRNRLTSYTNSSSAHCRHSVSLWHGHRCAALCVSEPARQVSRRALPADELTLRWAEKSFFRLGTIFSGFRFCLHIACYHTKAFKGTSLKDSSVTSFLYPRPTSVLFFDEMPRSYKLFLIPDKWKHCHSDHDDKEQRFELLDIYSYKLTSATA